MLLSSLFYNKYLQARPKTQKQEAAEQILGQTHSMHEPFSYSTISLGHEHALVEDQVKETGFITKSWFISTLETLN